MLKFNLRLVFIILLYPICINNAYANTLENFSETILSDGSVYFGQLKNGAPHGQGRMTLPNGVLYVGQFKNSKFNGAGTLYKIDGSKVIGFFLDGFSHGYTKTILPNGKIEEDYYIDYGIANLVKESNWEQKIGKNKVIISPTNIYINNNKYSLEDGYLNLTGKKLGRTVNQVNVLQRLARHYEDDKSTIIHAISIYEFLGDEYKIPDSFYWIGQLYWWGDVIEQNHSLAIKHWKYAAENGSALAAGHVAKVNRNTQKYDTAKYFYTLSANLGRDNAKYELAQIYEIEKDYDFALFWLNKSIPYNEKKDLNKYPYNFIQVMSENLNEAINHNYLDYPVCKAPSQQYWDNCFGVQSYNDDEDYYIGTFSNGKREGIGKYVWSTGQVYKGEWKNGIYNGIGELKLTSGITDRGQFINGKLNGLAIEFYTDTKEIIYQGIWENNIFQSNEDTSSLNTLILENTLFVDKDSKSNLQNPLIQDEEIADGFAELQFQQSQIQQATSTDTQIPLITITRAETDDKQGIVVGRVSDNVGVAEVIVDGNVVPITNNGSFEYSTYVPATGKTLEVQVTDLAGLSSSQTVTLERNVNLATASISFDELNPIAKPAKSNNNALALIIGVSDYENTPAKAIYADIDAIIFRDYASEKLGIPDNRIKTLVNDGADKRELLLSINNWLSRSVKQDQTDVYVFFAGHGLASDDGQNMYLLPYDGSPEFLDDTAFLRDRIFSDIASANPRSVTVFLDTCYSGSTRGSEMLIAARPILLKAKDSAVPEGFTVFTAAAGDETAKPLEEAKHGMFSYFLMKGMEGNADTNGDKQITASELHAYVKSNVIQQSSGTQTPELQGDTDRVLVQFK
jgi:hypothetical protein